MATKDLYAILGVERDADDKKIKKSYRNLSLKYHPDRQQGKSEQEQKEAEEKFKEINEAYSVLSDPEKKQQYDMFGTVDGQPGGGNPFSGFGGGGFGGFDDIFNIFGGGRGAGSRQQVRPGNNIQMKVPLDIKDIYCGCTKKLKFTRDVRCATCHGDGGTDVKICPHCGGTGRIVRQTQQGHAIFRQESECPHCHGTGKVVGKPCMTCGGSGFKQESNIVEVTFPAGVQENQYVEYTGQGSEAKKHGHPNGDFIAIAKYNYDRSRYLIQGLDITEYIHIDYYDALLGTEYMLELPDGKKMNLHINECTEPNKKYILRGKGITATDRFGRELKGDYYVQVVYDIPDKLTEKDRKALESIRKHNK